MVDTPNSEAASTLSRKGRKPSEVIVVPVSWAFHASRHELSL